MNFSIAAYTSGHTIILPARPIFLIQQRGIFRKEIIIKQHRYFQQQTGVDVLPLENLIDVVATKSQLVRKPLDTVPLLVKFLTYFFTNVKFFHIKVF